MRYRTFAAIWLTLSLALTHGVGCAASRPADAPAAADLPPIPANYRDLIRDHLNYSVLGEFAEGYRADIDLRDPYPAAFLRHNESDWRYGHAVRAYATTPVRYGGYLAAKPYDYFFHDGALRPVSRGDRLLKLR